MAKSPISGAVTASVGGGAAASESAHGYGVEQGGLMLAFSTAMLGRSVAAQGRACVDVRGHYCDAADMLAAPLSGGVVESEQPGGAVERAGAKLGAPRGGRRAYTPQPGTPPLGAGRIATRSSVRARRAPSPTAARCDGRGERHQAEQRDAGAVHRVGERRPRRRGQRRHYQVGGHSMLRALLGRRQRPSYQSGRTGRHRQQHRQRQHPRLQGVADGVRGSAEPDRGGRAGALEQRGRQGRHADRSGLHGGGHPHPPSPRA